MVKVRNVHQNHVGVQTVGKLDRFLPIACFSDAVAIPRLGQEYVQALAEQLMIIRDEHSDHRTSRHLAANSYPRVK